MDLRDDEILSHTMTQHFWTWSAQKRVAPLVVTQEGVYFWDAAGRRKGG